MVRWSDGQVVRGSDNSRCFDLSYVYPSSLIPIHHHHPSIPRSQELWFFYGAPIEDLEAVGSALEPNVYDEGAVLCDSPRDPCATMSLIVLGSLTALRGGARSASQVVEKLTDGGVPH